MLANTPLTFVSSKIVEYCSDDSSTFQMVMADSVLTCPAKPSVRFAVGQCVTQIAAEADFVLYLNGVEVAKSRGGVLNTTVFNTELITGPGGDLFRAARTDFIGRPSVLNYALNASKIDQMVVKFEGDIPPFVNVTIREYVLLKSIACRTPASDQTN